MQSLYIPHVGEHEAWPQIYVLSWVKANTSLYVAEFKKDDKKNYIIF